MRLRFRFVKTGKVRWTSHRDVARMWERAFRRVQLPLAYSQGFSPRPKVSFGLALPTGAESLAEYLDVELAAGTEIDADALPDRLSAALPAGVDVTAAGVLDAGAASLQSEVTSCCWSVTVTGLAPAALGERVAAATAAASLVVSRERKGVRARPGGGR
jgi:radical SAM-linked protein